jgi:hypothetical protein
VAARSSAYNTQNLSSSVGSGARASLRSTRPTLLSTDDGGAPTHCTAAPHVVRSCQSWARRGSKSLPSSSYLETAVCEGVGVGVAAAVVVVVSVGGWYVCVCVGGGGGGKNP